MSPGDATLTLGPRRFSWDVRDLAPIPTFAIDGARVKLLRDGREAFPTMLEAIRRAKAEILLEMYWVGDDLVGRTFLAALVEKAREGVPVRVVVDAIGSLGLSARFWDPLERAGGLVYVYHALSPFSPTFQPWGIERRNHRKVLVIDADIAFTGGINLALPWLPIEDGGEGFRDDAMEVCGPAVTELRALFYKTWQHVTGTRPPANVLPLVPGRARRVWVLTSHGSRKMRRGILREYLFRIQRARTRIDLANAYFVPEGSFRHALYGAARRGVRVRILVPFRGDVAVVQHAQESLYQDFLDQGLEVHLLRGGPLHSKTAIIDDDFVTSGSYNFDERSRSKNLETNLAIEDGPFARHVRGEFEADLTSSVRLTSEAWRGRGTLRRGVEVLSFMLRRFW